MTMKCRFCSSSSLALILDLGSAPLSNSFLGKDDLEKPEPFFPLSLWVCENCFLVQIAEYDNPNEIFDAGYHYFSSFSQTWLDHAKRYAEMIIPRLALDGNSFVLEIASNDGYLLRNFAARKIPCLGIEPAANTAAAARELGIEVVTEYFGFESAKKIGGAYSKADLIIGNNVFAHVPDINDFVRGLALALNDGGVITLEFPHVLNLVRHSQFDTVYHEHFSYFSLFTVMQIFAKFGLRVFDVEELPTHGGSLRVYAGRESDNSHEITGRVSALLDKETGAGINALPFYTELGARADRIRNDLTSFLAARKASGRKVAAYGAAAKGNTLLNYCGIKRDLLSFVADLSPHKQGKYLPGSHVPVVPETRIKSEKPDYVLVLPWNIKEEIMEQLGYIRDWGGKFVLPIPELKII